MWVDRKILLNRGVLDVSKPFIANVISSVVDVLLRSRSSRR